MHDQKWTLESLRKKARKGGLSGQANTGLQAAAACLPAASVLLALVLAGVFVGTGSGCKKHTNSGSAKTDKGAVPARSGPAGKTPARKLPKLGASVPVGRLARIAPKVLSVGGLRKHLNDKGTLHFAAVLLQTPQKGLDCLAKQEEHHHSCPPPYFTFGDTEPYSGSLPRRLGARVLVMMQPKTPLQTHHTYVVMGHWCHDRNLARFCGQAVWRIPDEEGRRFWKEVVIPSLPQRPRPSKARQERPQGH